MSALQNFLHSMEMGRGRIFTRLIPLTVTVAVVILLLNHSVWILGGVYRGLNDAQSMDNAQLARQIERGHGFNTQFLRPYALRQIGDFRQSRAFLTGQPGELFPASKFTAHQPRTIPDTYNSPLYPYLLAAWFGLLHVSFDQTPQEMATSHFYHADRCIPLLNQLLVVLTAILVAILAHRVFDDRVAWVASLAFLATGSVWAYSLTALPTNLLMLLLTAIFLLATEIFAVGENAFRSDEASFWPAWPLTLALALLVGLACLARLNLIVLIAPLLVFLAAVPRTNLLLLPLFALIALALVAPWFWRNYQVCGNFLGSNTPLITTGEDDYTGNQVYRHTTLPASDRLFKDVAKKEYEGFLWHFNHAWELLGSSPLVIFFVAGLMHPFKRPRAQAFRWLLVGAGILLVAANSLAQSQPGPIDGWNIVILLLPCLLVAGTAFFFVLLDRLNLDMQLFQNALVGAVLFLTMVPLMLMIYLVSSKYYNYPPYSPPFINLASRLARPEEWVTSDLPWATAWYGDRASLWLPDSISDFEQMNDDLCPTGILLITPVTLGAPVTNLTSGEDKAWFSFIIGAQPPANFPLTAHVMATNGPEYILWSNVPRWQ
jgi:hypothetical protein